MANLRRGFLPLAAVCAFAFAVPGLAAAPNAPSVQILRAGFSPATVTIKAGGAVSILNNDTVDHTLESPAAKMAPTVLRPTDNVSQAFATPGTFVIVDTQNASIKLTVVVQEAAAAVRLVISPTNVQSGKSATLSGSISTGGAGQQVRVEASSCGSSKFTGAKTLTTGNGGAFRLAVTPQSNTTYRVRFGDATATVGAQVTPLLRLRKTGSGTYLVTVGGAEGKVVSVQTRPAGKGWRPTGRAKIRGGVARFSLKAAPGTRVRASFDSKAAGACLGTGVSNVVTS